MRVTKQHAKIVPENADILKQLEERGRICYKSEDRITDESPPIFVDKAIKRGHNTVLEMAVICVNRIVSRPTKYMKTCAGITSASVRAWREYAFTEGLDHVPQAFRNRFPKLFNEFCPRGHLTIIPMPTNDLDHTYVCVKFVTNRAVTHEIVRHRPCSFLQESQRYVRYDTEDGIVFIEPVGLKNRSMDSQTSWDVVMRTCELAYQRMLENGDTPQQARGVLPNDTKTEILVYCNLREWRHIFFMRTGGGADPQMIALMKPLLEEFRNKYPGHFDKLTPSVG